MNAFRNYFPDALPGELPFKKTEDCTIDIIKGVIHITYNLTGFVRLMNPVNDFWRIELIQTNSSPYCYTVISVEERWVFAYVI